MNGRSWLALAALPAAIACSPLAQAASASSSVSTLTVDLTDLDPGDGIAPALTFAPSLAYQTYLLMDARHPYLSASRFGYGALDALQPASRLHTETGPRLAVAVLSTSTAGAQLEGRAVSRLYFDLTPNTQAVLHMPYMLALALAPGDRGLASVSLEGAGPIHSSGGAPGALASRTGAVAGELTARLVAGAGATSGELGLVAVTTLSAVPEPSPAGMLLAGLWWTWMAWRRRRN